jgi:hypothetical protein
VRLCRLALSALYSTDTAPEILQERNGLKMVRINAAANAAQVVQL